MNSLRFMRGIHRPRWLQVGVGVAVLAVGVVAMSLLLSTPTPASAATVAQCNGEMNGGGTQVACTTTVINYLTEAGTLSASPPSTITTTRCVGASGPLSSLTCATATTSLTAPVLTVQQCNGSGNGGGGTVNCTVTITNHFTGSRDAITAATVYASVYQCVGSAITGPGAPAVCNPDNTPGVTSVTGATVGQCNGSGNGGTSVGFVCTVTGGSTVTSIVPVNVDQCNDSGNGGGALVTCQTTVVNDVIAVVQTATPTATPTVAPTSGPTPGPTAVPTVTPPTVTPPAAPPPASTGSAGLADRGGVWPIAVLMLGVATAALVVTSRRLLSRSNRR